MWSSLLFGSARIFCAPCGSLRYLLSSGTMIFTQLTMKTVSQRHSGKLTMPPHRFRSPKKAISQRKSWEESYQHLKDYKERNGHCNVPYREGQLGPWVSQQIRVLPSQEKCALLDLIGFNWKKQRDRFDDKWKEKFERLKEFKRQNGQCNIVVRNEEDPGLGQ